MSEQREKKYTLVDGDWIEIIDAEHKKHVLHRIRAIKDFSDVKVGDYGGYVESEENLNQYDESWLYSDAVRISKNTRAWGKSRVFGKAKLYNSAEVCDYAIVGGESKLYESAKVHGRAKVSGNCYIHGIADVSGKCRVHGIKINIYDNVTIKDDALLYGTMDIGGVSTISGNTTICGNSIIISGHTVINGCTNIRDNANILSNNDFISVTNLGFKRDVLTAYLTKSNIIMISLGSFTGTYDEFTDALENEKIVTLTREKIVGDPVETEYANYQEYIDFLEIIKKRFENNRIVGGLK